MKLGLTIAALIGAGFVVWLAYYLGIDAVAAAIASVGVAGFALSVVVGLILFVILGLAWSALVLDGRPSVFIWGRTVRDCTGELLPFSQLGGLVIGARSVMLKGVSGPMAFGSTVVDMTVEMSAQLLFVLIGIVLCLIEVQFISTSLGTALGVGLLAAIAAVVAFLFVQKRGIALAERIAHRFFPKLAMPAAQLGQTVTAIYARPRAIIWSFVFHFLGWVGSAFAAWLFIRLMGIDIGFDSVLVIEALLCAIRSAAVIVPGALGVQEAGYAGLAPLFGLPPEVGLAVSLLRRARDIVIGVPVILWWQAMEGKRALTTAPREVREN